MTMAKRFVTEYRHVDGTRWVGPDYWADTFEEALAMEYPVQPIVVIGEFVETVPANDGDMEIHYRKNRSLIH